MNHLMTSTSLHFIYLRSILILSFHLCLGISNNLVSSEFPTTIMGAYLIPSLRTTLTVPLSPHHFNNPVLDLYDKWYRLRRSSLCNCLNLLVHLT